MSSPKITRIVGFFIAVSFCVILTGCTTSGLTPSTMTVSKKCDKSVKVVANSKIGFVFNSGRASTLRAAIENAIEKHGVFSKATQSGDTDYRLDVVETKMTLPPVLIGNITEGLTWDWKLTNVQTQKVVWQETINSQYTATFGESSFSWLGNIRMKNASYGAIRENIKIGLERISTLSL